MTPDTNPWQDIIDGETLASTGTTPTDPGVPARRAQEDLKAARVLLRDGLRSNDTQKVRNALLMGAPAQFSTKATQSGDRASLSLINAPRVRLQQMLGKTENDPLTMAAMHGNVPMMEVLMAHGASLHEAEARGLDLFDLSLLASKIEVARFLHEKRFFLGTDQHLTNLLVRPKSNRDIVEWWMDQRLPVAPARTMQASRRPGWTQQWVQAGLAIGDPALFPKLQTFLAGHDETHAHTTRRGLSWTSPQAGPLRESFVRHVFEADDPALLQAVARAGFAPGEFDWRLQKDEGGVTLSACCFWAATKAEATRCMDLMLASPAFARLIEQDLQRHGAKLYAFIPPTEKVLTRLQATSFDPHLLLEAGDPFGKKTLIAGYMHLHHDTLTLSRAVWLAKNKPEILWQEDGCGMTVFEWMREGNPDTIDAANQMESKATEARLRAWVGPAGAKVKTHRL